MKKKVSIITTVDHNVGDDFVREGLKHIIKSVCKDSEFSNIHKHSPITSRKGFEGFRNYRYSKRLDPILPILNKQNDLILSADVVIQSGAPVYWCHPMDKNYCSKNEWYKPLINRRWRKNPVPLLNLAAGTCQAYHSDLSEFQSHQDEIEYIKEFHRLASVTTLRDKASKKLFNNIGIDAPVIPCSSIFAKDYLNMKSEKKEYVVLNFMSKGAHFSIGQNIQEQKWLDSFVTFYHSIKDKEKIVFSCHNSQEFELAKCIDPNANIFFKKNDYLAYMELYSKAKIGIVNRVHAAFMMASFGTPSFTIGNDTRALMTEQIQLENAFVNDVSSTTLKDQYQKLDQMRADYPNLIEKIKKDAFEQYTNEVSKAF